MSEQRFGICGVICNCGPNSEPIACGYADGHKGPHSWASLPTFIAGKNAAEIELRVLDELVKCKLLRYVRFDDVVPLAPTRQSDPSVRETRRQIDDSWLETLRPSDVPSGIFTVAGPDEAEQPMSERAYGAMCVIACVFMICLTVLLVS